MSKKIASGADGIVLDVKVGRGAFMKDIESAKKLANLMVEIGNSVGRKTVAHVTNMDEPLGLAIGNSLEVVEAIDVLKGNGSKDLIDVCMVLGADMLTIAGVAKDTEEANKMMEEALTSGKALEKFKEFIKAQGGDERIVDDLSLLPQAKYVEAWVADEDLYIKDLYALDLGLIAMRLGAGRSTKEDTIDLSVGIMLGGKIGDLIKKGQPIATVYANDKNKLDWAMDEIKKYVVTTDGYVERPQLIYM